jgi:Helix-turn-helix
VFASQASILKAIEKERLRQGISKAFLARRAGLPSQTVRRILVSDVRDLKLSTILKMAQAVSIRLVPKLVDDGLDENESKMVMTDVRRRLVAEKMVEGTDLDAGDVEHVLRNLEISPAERVRRSFERARGLRHKSA